MGAGASIPESIDANKAKELAGDKWDDAAFEKLAGADGCITKDQLLDAAKVGSAKEYDDKEMTEMVAREGMFFSFSEFDTDDSGGLTYEEFAVAATQLGFAIDEKDLDKVCKEIDADSSGIIDQKEFVAFIMARQKPVAVEITADMDVSSVFEYIRPSEAQYGYATAIAVLKKNPKAASAPMPGECTGSPWQALHVVLTQDSGKGLGADVEAAAAAARRLAAEPLIGQLLKCYAPSANMRVMEGVRFPDGHLPLELAITRGWPASVVKMIADAYPAATTTLDQITRKKGTEKPKEAPTALKGLRWMRKIAEDVKAGVDDDVLLLLPKPKAAEGKITWVDGKTVAAEDAEKARKKAEKEAKKQAKLEAKKAKEEVRMFVSLFVGRYEDGRFKRACVTPGPSLGEACKGGGEGGCASRRNGADRDVTSGADGRGDGSVMDEWDGGTWRCEGSVRAHP